MTHQFDGGERRDAARYRLLCVLVERGEWCVGKSEIVDGYGSTNETWMGDKAQMDEELNGMDILERLNSRLNDTDQGLMSSAVDEIMRLRQDKIRRGKLLADIFNCVESDLLPSEILQRIDDELMGYNAI